MLANYERKDIYYQALDLCDKMRRYPTMEALLNAVLDKNPGYNWEAVRDKDLDFPEVFSQEPVNETRSRTNTYEMIVMAREIVLNKAIAKILEQKY